MNNIITPSSGDVEVVPDGFSWSISPNATSSEATFNFEAENPILMEIVFGNLPDGITITIIIETEDGTILKVGVLQTSLLPNNI